MYVPISLDYQIYFENFKILKIFGTGMHFVDHILPDIYHNTIRCLIVKQAIFDVEVANVFTVTICVMIEMIVVTGQMRTLLSVQGCLVTPVRFRRCQNMYRNLQMIFFYVLKP